MSHPGPAADCEWPEDLSAGVKELRERVHRFVNPFVSGDFAPALAEVAALVPGGEARVLARGPAPTFILVVPEAVGMRDADTPQLQDELARVAAAFRVALPRERLVLALVRSAASADELEASFLLGDEDVRRTAVLLAVQAGDARVLSA